MQPTVDFDHQIIDAHLPQSVNVVHNATAVDTNVDLLKTHPAAGDTQLAIEWPRGHMSLERGFEGGYQRLNPGHPETGQIAPLGGTGLETGEP